MTVTDTNYITFAQLLLNCLCNSLAQTANPVTNCCLRTGALNGIGSDLCVCGMAWVRIGNIYPSSQFPAQDTAPQLCGPYSNVLELEMGVSRCRPQGDAMNPVDCEAETALAVVLANDREAMRQALCCAVGPLERDMWVDGGSQPLEAQGSCIGTTHTLLVQILCPSC
jgi:hypothetical protein